MELLQDPSDAMRTLNGRLRGFLEQVNRLQGTNRQLEAQIAEWGVRGSSHSQDWSEQEQTVSELRAQVSLFFRSSSVGVHFVSFVIAIAEEQVASPVRRSHFPPGATITRVTH